MNQEEVNGVHIPQILATAPLPFIPWWEWAGVGVVGLLLGGTARMIGAKGAVGGALLYLAGYWVRNRRPAAGYSFPVPSPMQALLSGERPGVVTNAPQVIGAPPQ
jgi:hypothetical protein